MSVTKTIDLKTVCECNRCLGCKTLHPQAALINLSEACPPHDTVKFEFYAILLIEDGQTDGDCCGRKYYDFAYASMVFLTPGEMFRLSAAGALPRKGWLLTFHPDLLCRTSLRSHIADYTFFGYSKTEALHLSLRETSTVTCCLEHIENELHHAIDSHTSTILSRHIELLLDYCTRFYERQFITRENRNRTILSQLKRLVDDCIDSGRTAMGNLPTAEEMAERLGLSPAYFADFLRFETGHSFETFFELKRLEAAKRLLLSATLSPADVSRRLGFKNVQHFTRLFKLTTGVAPSDYLSTQN